MGWFDEQIKDRIRKDNESFSEGFERMANAVLGSRIAGAMQSERVQARDALSEVFRYYHEKMPPYSDMITDVTEQMEHVLRPSGIMHRMVYLEGEWWKDAAGVMIGSLKDTGGVVALIPTGISGMGGYYYTDYATGGKVHVNKKTAGRLDHEALCFYRPLPQREITMNDLIKFMLESRSQSDYISEMLIALAVALVGMIPVKIESIIFSSVVFSKDYGLLLSVFVFFLGVKMSQVLFGGVKTLVTGRKVEKISNSVQVATYMRILSLPSDFFRRYTSGELAMYLDYLNELVVNIFDSIIGAALTAIFSLVYLIQLFTYGPQIMVPCLIMILIMILSSMLSMYAFTRMEYAITAANSRENGVSFALISGVQKIKLAGAEKRAFAKWAEYYSDYLNENFNVPALYRLGPVMSSCIGGIGTVVIYYYAMKANLNVAEYIPFVNAFGLITGAFSGFAAVTPEAGRILPVFKLIKPIFETKPDVAKNRFTISRISGAIEMNNVTFRYDHSMPPVLNNLSLKIRSGQYTAIVGKTGCGKSTLFRILLGFETPNRGAVYYDGRDVAGMDLKSLRQHIGVVLQDEKLFQGDIFSNITISSPGATLEDAWEAARMAGVAEDIEKMPMGMNTIISEGSGGISGGQRQRILIARAIVMKPRLIMFDEATSALDNVTQKIVSDSLEKLKCTRIVIAHRLSTIRHCDRIIVLDQGRIAEEGTFEELMEKNGIFCELAERQMAK
ncbi:MAG: ATP-binding cassette domain-containing protein [Lachnospiraceae bacterium]|nr:ATP-binding cassette domain-containing protein [Lachnospiraceae bacterium]